MTWPGKTLADLVYLFPYIDILYWPQAADTLLAL